MDLSSGGRASAIKAATGTPAAAAVAGATVEKPVELETLPQANEKDV